MYCFSQYQKFCNYGAEKKKKKTNFFLKNKTVYHQLIKNINNFLIIAERPWENATLALSDQAKFLFPNIWV